MNKPTQLPQLPVPKVPRMDLAGLVAAATLLIAGGLHLQAHAVKAEQPQVIATGSATPSTCWYPSTSGPGLVNLRHVAYVKSVFWDNSGKPSDVVEIHFFNNSRDVVGAIKLTRKELPQALEDIQRAGNNCR